MRVFVTGATGFIGSAVVRELLGAGHQVTGLARSDAKAAALAATGAEVRRGDLGDLAGLAEAAAAADGVIHTAYNHDFSDMGGAAGTDQAVIAAMGDALAGSGRPLVVASGTALAPGRLVTEADGVPDDHAHPRRSEQRALPYAGRGVAAAAVRLPPTVHGEGDHGFIPQIIRIARERGVSGYPGDGANHWAAVHRLDAAKVFRLALEAAEPGVRWHAVGDQGVPVREIAEVIGRHLGLPTASVPPEQAAEHFGWIGRFWSLDVPAASAVTRARLGWEPIHQGLLADLEEGHYFKD
jgi:nucleoside-diphosphate-sugar epimerase